ncbi:MAG: o-succinylbenzoate synthase [Actinomycetes bacterium]
MASALPSVDALLDGSVGFTVPLTTRFRGTQVRQGLLLHGPIGWAEFAPFGEYDAKESARWLSAAIESGWIGWPQPVRSTVPVNAIIPAVDPERAAALTRQSGCSTAKVKVGETDQSIAEDIARVAAVREALGPQGRVRIDANGAWSTEEAIYALEALQEFDLEYVEQPCGSLVECAAVRRVVDMPVAIDEGVRKAPDPHHVIGLREAADVLVLKAAPLGGIRPALAVADTYGLPCVVSSAIDTSVGLAAGLALAAALPQLSFACGLGSGQLLIADVTSHRVMPELGKLTVRPTSPDPDTVLAVAMSPRDLAAWRYRLSEAYSCLTESPGGAG